jgi:hypothetical protein
VPARLTVGLNAAIVAVTREVPRVLTVGRSDLEENGAPDGEAASAVDALPFGPLHPEEDRTLELGLRRWVREQAGIEVGYVEQLYTFGDRHRDPRELAGGPRVISVGYLALVREEQPSGAGAAWRDVYRFFPWEDWREGRPPVLERRIVPALDRWIADAPGGAERARRRERAEIVFGLGGVAWDGDRVLDRYELLYEAGLAAEARRDRQAGEGGGRPPGGEAEGGENVSGVGGVMALDHRRILATALGRLRGKIRYRPVVFELLPPTFTLLQLQRTVEALAGVRLHKGNFRRLVEKGGLVEGTGHQDTSTGGRPAEIFRFRHEVLRERPAPGVGLPGVRT